MKKLNFLTLIISAVLITGCESDTQQIKDTEVQASKSQEVEVTQVTESESEKANVLFEKIFMDGVMRSPMTQSYLGIKIDNDKWNDFSEANALAEHEIDKANLVKVNAINVEKLDEQTKVSLRLQQESLKNSIDDFKWRTYL